jgi:hypothetical protein
MEPVLHHCEQQHVGTWLDHPGQLNLGRIASKASREIRDVMADEPPHKYGLVRELATNRLESKTPRPILEKSAIASVPAWHLVASPGRWPQSTSRSSMS